MLSAMNFQVNESVEALDEDGVWSGAKIKDVDRERRFVEFDGWDSCWGRWLCKEELREKTQPENAAEIPSQQM